MSVVTIKPITQAGIPQPMHRFSGTDSSVVMTNRPSTFGGSGVPSSDGGSSVFNVETIDTTANLAARTGDAQGFLAYDKTTGQLYVAYGSDFWTKHGAD